MKLTNEQHDAMIKAMSTLWAKTGNAVSSLFLQQKTPVTPASVATLLDAGSVAVKDWYQGAVFLGKTTGQFDDEDHEAIQALWTRRLEALENEVSQILVEQMLKSIGIPKQEGDALIDALQDLIDAAAAEAVVADGDPQGPILTADVMAAAFGQKPEAGEAPCDQPDEAASGE